jgi:hypothetical protein
MLACVPPQLLDWFVHQAPTYNKLHRHLGVTGGTVTWTVYYSTPTCNINALPSPQGTATDAVLLDGQHQPPTLLAKAKEATTTDVLTGIAAALMQLHQQYTPGFEAVQAVFLGTTQFVNAVVQRQGLAKVFVVRLCGTATKALPPYLGIPPELQTAVAAGYLLASGRQLAQMC